MQLELVVPMKIADASFGVKKGSPFSRFLNFEITKMRRSGLLQRIMKRNALKEHFCPAQANFDGKVPIKFQKVIFPFSILLLGALFSLIFFSIEIIK